MFKWLFKEKGCAKHMNNKLEVIGIDHGWSMMKTISQVFVTGVKEITTTPALFGDVLEYEGKFYKVLIQPTERAEHDRRVNNMSIRKVVAGLLIAAGIAIMAVPFFWRATGEKQTEQLISEFEQTLEDDYDEETDVEEEQTSISKEDEAILKEGGVIGIIEIPGLDIRYPVMEGTTSKVLNAGIGHIEETAGIGESGNCVLCGHNGSRYGTFFTPLNQISIGDDVTIIDKNGQTHIYEVTDTEVVNPYDNSIKTQGEEKELTLFTCSQKGTMRFVVRCRYKEAGVDE